MAERVVQGAVNGRKYRVVVQDEGDGIRLLHFFYVPPFEPDSVRVDCNELFESEQALMDEVSLRVHAQVR